MKGLVAIVPECEIIVRTYGIGSVNVSINNLSHKAMQE